MGYLFWGLDSDHFKADTVTDNYTMVTSQGLLLWLRPQRTTASIPWKMEKSLVEIPFPIRSSLFLQCFCWHFVIFKDWVYFLPVYSQPFNSILLLQQMCREGGLDTHQVHRTMQNTFFSPEKMENRNYPLLWRMIHNDLWRCFYLEVTQALLGIGVEFRSSKRESKQCLINIHIREEWLVVRGDYFFKRDIKNTTCYCFSLVNLQKKKKTLTPLL